MTSRFFAIALVCLAVALITNGSTPRAADDPPKVSNAQEANRSPVAVAVTPDRRFAATANQTSDTVSLIDLETLTVVDESPCGEHPVDLSWTDDATLFVTARDDDAIVVFQRTGAELKRETKVPIGDEPHAIALDPPETKHRRAFVAVAGRDDVAVVDIEQRAVIRRIPIGGQPRSLGVSPDGQWIVTCSDVPGECFVHDAKTLKLVSRRFIFDDAFNIGKPVFTSDSQQAVIPAPVNRHFPVDEHNIERGWVLDNRLTALRLPDAPHWQQKQLGLDVRGNAAGDVHAAAFSPDGKKLAVTCGGTHELFLFHVGPDAWPGGNPSDFLPDRMADPDYGQLDRIELGGRPLGLAFIDEGRIAIANYFLDAVQILDVRKKRVAHTIDLGGPEKPSLARKGEMIFHDADRSLAGWFSCATCHPGGHTSGQIFDTENDGNFDTHKLAPSLRGVTETRPWTWHGWQESLPAAMHKSLESTLRTEADVSDEDVEALLAYLATLKHRPSPHRNADGTLTEAARRGRTLFNTAAGCADCHSGPHFTTDATYKVGLKTNWLYYDEFNPPSLRGLHARRRFLHDGRATKLRDVLTIYHKPETLNGRKLSEEELDDLLAYLRAL